MNRNKLAALIAILIIALALVGVGYGLWFEDFKIHGEVTTGDLDVGFSDPGIVEWFTDQDDNAKAVRYQGVSYPTRLEPKFDTVSCTYEYETDVDLPDSPEPGVDTGEEFLRINITGAYPSYHCLVSFDVTSFGTVPIHLTEPALSPDSETEDWVATKVCFQHVMPPQEHMPTDLVVWYRDAPGQTCNPNPKSDLKTLSAMICDDTVCTQTITNRSRTCEYLVGMASYEKIENYTDIGLQRLWDYQYSWLGQDSWTATVEVPQNPRACAWQVDVFWGPVLWTLDGLNRYSSGVPPETSPWWMVNRKLGGEWHGYLHSSEVYQPDLPLCQRTIQLHQNDSAYCSILMHFTNESQALVDGQLDYVQENQTYEFQYHIRAYQWNEQPDMAPGWPLQ